LLAAMFSVDASSVLSSPNRVAVVNMAGENLFIDIPF
jgi:hypothetical protein